jgi:hypothetical protein
MLSDFLQYEPPFKLASARIREQAWFTKEWICKCGPWPATEPQCLILKLLKRRWSNDDPAVIGN